MAYAYTAVDDLLDQNQKQNIFAQDPSAPQTGQPQGGSNPQVKTSTEGELGGSAMSAPAGSTAAPVQDSFDQSKADRAAFKANEGRTAQPKIFSNLETQLQQKSQNLQKEADQYVASQRANQNYAIQNEGLEKAIGGSAEDARKTRDLLNRQNINQVEGFKPTDVKVRDTDLLGTNAGLQQLVSRGQGPSYTKGMGAFDLQSLQRNKDFTNLVSMIKGEQSDLQKSADKAREDRQKEVESYGKAQLTDAQKTAREYLGSQSSAIDAQNEAEAKAFNEQLAKYRAAGVGDAEIEALKKARDSAAANLGQYDTRSAAMLGDVKVDPRSYLKVREDAGRDQFVDQNEAQRFNSIMGLLGGGDVRSAAQPIGDPYSFDRAALENSLISGAQGLRGAKDVKSKAELDQIMKQAQEAADADDARRANLDLRSIAEQQAEAARGGLDKSLLEYYDPSLVDAAGYIYGDKRDLGAADVYSKEQADKLNALYADLGLQDQVSAGAGLGSPGYNFGKNEYLNALKGLLSGRKSEADAAAAAAAEEARKAQAEADGSSTVDPNDVYKIPDKMFGGIPTGVTNKDKDYVEDRYIAGRDYVNDRFQQTGIPTPRGPINPDPFDPVTQAAINSLVNKSKAAGGSVSKKAKKVFGR